MPESEVKKRDLWDKADVIGKWLIPLAVVFATIWFNSSVKQREENQKTLEIAIGILQAPPSKETANLRNWAVEKAEKAGISQKGVEELRNGAQLPEGAQTAQAKGYYIFIASVDDPGKARELKENATKLLNSSREDLLNTAGVKFVPDEAQVWPPVPPNRYYKIVVLYGIQELEVATKAKEILVKKYNAPEDMQIMPWQ